MIIRNSILYSCLWKKKKKAKESQEPMWCYHIYTHMNNRYNLDLNWIWTVVNSHCIVISHFIMLIL